MPDRNDLEALFLGHLALIERITRSVCGRRGIRGDEAVECESWVKLRLVEDDYTILRKFRGESALSTYLTVVIAMLVRDYRVQRWGRWRPSAAAQRRGAVAIRLESLIYRQGYRLHEAAEVLRSTDQPALRDRDVGAIVRDLPRRLPQRPVDVGAEPLADQAGRTSAEDLVDTAAKTADHDAVQQALARALDGLSPEDRLVLRLRFWSGSSVADIARTLELPQKPLYRQIERALGRLRAALESGGLTRERVRELFDEIST
jgi:RNA polymerase sigma factor (sigma-70 family)